MAWKPCPDVRNSVQIRQRWKGLASMIRYEDIKPGAVTRPQLVRKPMPTPKHETALEHAIRETGAMRAAEMPEAREPSIAPVSAPPDPVPLKAIDEAPVVAKAKGKRGPAPKATAAVNAKPWEAVGMSRADWYAKGKPTA
jgi:hypothetical protein